MNFGLPYKGSKSRIAPTIIDALPAADTLIDLFAGGSAITHAALLSGKYRHIIANDLLPFPRAFLSLITAAPFALPDPTRFISYDDFILNARRKETADTFGYNPLIDVIWSFGNNCRTYAYARSREEYIHALHDVIALNSYDRLLYLALRPDYTGVSPEALHAALDRAPLLGRTPRTLLQYINRRRLLAKPLLDTGLEHIQRLNRIFALYNTFPHAPLTVCQTDYRSLIPNPCSLPPNTIIYADPPYHSTEGYTSKNRATSFSTPDFLRWAAASPLPVYISEYSIDDPRFRLVKEIPRSSAFSAYKAPVRTITERLYANPAASCYCPTNTHFTSN